MLTKLVMLDKIVTPNRSMVLYQPIWNVSGVTTVYTKNGQDPLQVIDQAYSTQSFIPVDRSCVLRFVGIKTDHYTSPIYQEIFTMNDVVSRRDIQAVNESIFYSIGQKSDLYDTSTQLRLSDGTSCKGRYFPNMRALSKVGTYKLIEVSGKLKDRIDLIAYEYLGNSQLWWVIAECNRDKIIDPMNVPVGTKIRIPSTEDLFTRGVLRKDTDPIERTVLDQF